MSMDAEGRISSAPRGINKNLIYKLILENIFPLSPPVWERISMKSPSDH